MKQYRNVRSKRSFVKTKRKRKIAFDFSFLRKIFNLRSLASLLCLLALGALGYFAAFSEYFMVKDIIVSGNESIPTGKIETVAREGMDGNIYDYLPAKNFWLVDGGALTERLRAQFPEIDTLVVSKSFPAGIEVVLTEKQPALIWCRGNCYLVNDQGVAYMPAEQEDLENQKKHFLKIVEESPIIEEMNEGSPDLAADKSLDSDETESEETPLVGEDEAGNEVGDPAEVPSEDAAVTQISENEQVSDGNFIRFALDVNTGLNRDGKVTVKYYKTKGYKTRELIAYTDKNIRLYFDATQSAAKQTENLRNFIEKGIEKEGVESLKYIYLKNTDRVFYK